MRRKRGVWSTRRPGVVSKYGTLLGLCVTTASSLFMAAANRLQPWEFVGAYLVLAGVLVCFALMLRSDAWPQRVAILLGLILLAELLGSEQRDEFNPVFLPYTLVLSASSVLVFSMRKTWRSMLFTFTAFLLVLGYTVISALVAGVRPASAYMLTAIWFITLAMRLGGPRALALYWGDFAVRQGSAAAHIVAQNRRSSVAWNARHLHDTALRTLTVIGRQGAGVSSKELGEMLDAGTSSETAARLGPTLQGWADVDFGASTPPKTPEPGDLAVRLRRVAEKRARDGFSVEIHGMTGPLAEPVQAALLAAVDECILNADRHAGAGHVDVLLSRTSDHVSVVVSDSGCGFDPSKLPTDRLGVKESVLARMRDAGGRAKVFSAPGRGTTILLEAVAA
ncbi:sensor histidine kinase [Arthrobacter sp. B2a2-09]|uniref:sensor histidine kinase n=1 Tax=Arthrobacter sp. B2a2-09 TaxID=2952822 RepID=UPI0022CDBC18|nr:ATP-binding protein [Arthrobacter sp. B2a2-09]MCZ9884274.1 ATP-binding protein [Arthrobacter sp. B2a2-09]